ncbi:hypothetical protein HDU92_006957 [Lobulomyces angularis]|nr:hypothetical protein HDU92_006957 [Lobulomyces angularis]
MIKVYQKELEDILKELNVLKSKKTVKTEEVSKIQKRIHKIDEKWKDGAIHSDKNEIEEGQAVLSDLLNDCHELVSDLLESSED